MGPVLLVLNVVTILCAIFITYKAFLDSAKWGLFFFLTPVVFYVLARYTGPLIAGAIVIGLQVYYVKNHWKEVGTPYVVMVVCWIGTLLVPRMMAG